jgi:hypothetical protein
VQRGAINTSRPQPFALLLPAWTSKWLPWRTFLWALARLRKGALEVPDAPRLARHALLTFIPQSDFDGRCCRSGEKAGQCPRRAIRGECSLRC